VSTIRNHRPLILHLRSRYLLDWRGIHGAAHWARVRAWGLFLAASSGADREVVELFAWLHDSCRENDDHDPEHGPRAARLAEELRDEFFPLDDRRFALLFEALHDHTKGRITDEPTIQTSWDADRLDLGRAGIHPDHRRMGTEAARDRGVIRRAWKRSRRWAEFRWRR
jgi:uncharacterized protein